MDFYRPQRFSELMISTIPLVGRRAARRIEKGARLALASAVREPSKPHQLAICWLPIKDNQCIERAAHIRRIFVPTVCVQQAWSRASLSLTGLVCSNTMPSEMVYLTCTQSRLRYDDFQAFDSSVQGNLSKFGTGWFQRNASMQSQPYTEDVSSYFAKQQP